MLLDGHTAPSVKDRLGLPNMSMLYRQKQEFLTRSGPVASSREARVKELESELRRVERERDVFTVFAAHWCSTALAIFGRNESPMCTRPSMRSLLKESQQCLKCAGSSM